LVALIDLDDANPLAPDSAELQPLAEEASVLAASLVAAMEDDPAKRCVVSFPLRIRV
jgi:hypothetical protein